MEAKRYLTSFLETDLSQDRLLTVKEISLLSQAGPEMTFSANLLYQKPLPGLLYFQQPEDVEEKLYFRLCFYGSQILRLQISNHPKPFVQSSPMLEMDASLQVDPLELYSEAGGWRVVSGKGAFLSAEEGEFRLRFSPDGKSQLHFQADDHFVENLPDSFPVFWLQRANGVSELGFALHIQPGEHFAGTGERFERPDLFGQQIDLVNFDAAGVNNPRAYKNIPFLLSSRGYGIFVHSFAKMRLDIGAHSTRTLQWRVGTDVLDIFFIGGGTPARVIENYRRLTGFPHLPPTWSFGVWMSRASYCSEAEVSAVAERLRAGGYPADVLHLDVGWFAKEWVCDWKFSPQNFPEPKKFLQRMRDLGFRVSLWQTPHIHPESGLEEVALQKGYIGQETERSHRHWLGYTLDFTNPEAVAWYQSLIIPLLEMGAAAIKTDFGEEVDDGALYAEMEGRKYHNLFALLYQKAAWEATERVYGRGNALIWARAGWAGSQRYPVHWGGDAAATFDGLAGTLRGGLHLGLSGFAFWSHDVGGIHGIPDFVHSRPSEEVYLRWTQVGVFSSHMRFHGGTPREPWEYPAVAGIVKEWLRFRYALLPYILEQAQRCCRGGLPLLRSLVFDWPDDPAVWSIADQYLFGDSFLVCPVLCPDNCRDVYLPEGDWTDFWSGEELSGPKLLHQVVSPLSRLPLYVRHGEDISFAEPVAHTELLPESRHLTIRFDEHYPGFSDSPLAEWIHL